MENQINSFKNLASLYDEFYIISEPVQEPVKENKKIDKTPIYSGNLDANLTFIYDINAELNEDTKLMLNKLVIDGLKLTWNDILVIDTKSNTDLKLNELIQFVKSDLIVYWGNQLALAPTHHISEHLGHSILIAHHPESYTNDQALKRALWAGLIKLTSKN